MKKPFVFVTTIILTSILAVIGDDLFIDSSAQEASESGDVNAASGSNRFIVWQDKTPGNFDIFFRRSTDNGATWKPVVNLSKNPGDSIAPQVVVSGANVYVAWVQKNSANDEVFFRRSTDNGATWKPVVNLSNNPNESFSDTVRIAVSGSKIYVAWDDNSCLSAICFFQHDVKFRRSTDNGATWKPTVNLSNSIANSRIQAIAATGSSVYVTWLEPSPELNDTFFRRSTDNGATWKPVVNLSEDSVFSGDSQIAVSGPNVLVTWFGSAGLELKVFLSRSTDSGATFQPTIQLFSNSNHIGPQQIHIVGANVYVVWNNIGSSNNEIYLRRSTDNGFNWKSILNLSNNPSASQLPQVTG